MKKKVKKMNSYTIGKNTNGDSQSAAKDIVRLARTINQVKKNLWVVSAYLSTEHELILLTDQLQLSFLYTAALALPLDLSRDLVSKTLSFKQKVAGEYLRWWTRKGEMHRIINELQKTEKSYAAVS